ncbi:phosphomannomutase [Nocardioides massiliensis]|uniref:Phosphomannomutase n=2 Tax=Nocardioides massiliensis TaxID=1325935 RepID=A0ABT9NP81_9ACTN|nr:phospho-sugar mutase [Nocardioides massiliensis]MDP9822229.1 phosphomannomutase [Nocardioides massiliensis]
MSTLEHATDDADLHARVTAWIGEDPDPATRAELSDLLAAARDGDAAAEADLAARFAGTLQFGTAGLRGALGGGPNRMNRVVVGRAAAGLAAYLDAQGLEGPVVIGYDARHGSEQFALDTAAIVEGAGRDALLLPGPLPTPVLAFAIRHLDAAAGVMVTASHNPPQDNGYKVYLGDGSQIVPPADVEIAAAIAAVGAYPDIPQAEGWTVLGEDVVTAYVDAVVALSPATERSLRVVTTPLHGVGGETLATVLTLAGFSDMHVVASQAAPDPDFPTVAFPNPEEPGAIDAALAVARAVDADLVIANDPDADRCALAVPGPEGDRDAWRMLRGDEVGALLAQHVLDRGDVPPDGILATSIVSSSLLGVIAAAAGVGYAETLTGFKWIGKVAGLAFGYEEALGYCVAPHLVRDKDGISAALLACELADRAKAEGRTLDDLLDDLGRRHGLHATDQLSVRVTDLAEIDTAMQRLRAVPPTQLGGFAVTGVDDLSAGSATLPATEGLRYRLAEGGRVVVRPSGTEPKLKCYLEVVVPVEQEAEDGVAAARIVAAQRLDAIRTDLAQAAGL